VELARSRVAALAEVLLASSVGCGDGCELPSCEGVGARVIFGKMGDASTFEFICGAGQPWPFVAQADEELLLRGRRSYLELLDYIGFEQGWAADKVASGVRFRLLLFALGDCGGSENIITPTWSGLMTFIGSQSQACAVKVAPHVAAMQQLPFSELVALGRTVDRVEPVEYALVCSFEAYADASTPNTLRSARAFLRHTLKCTALFAGDGYTRTEALARGAKEVLVPRCAVADLPGHRWVNLGGV
jgi:hypothetical protein